MIKTITTIYFQQYMNCKAFDKAYTTIPNTTLSELFNSAVSSSKEFELSYLTVGGNTKVVDNTVVDLTNSKHTIVDGCLFNHLPLYAVLKDMDSYNHDYRLKTEKLVGDDIYNIYYAKKIANKIKLDTIAIIDKEDEFNKSIYEAPARVLDLDTDEELPFNATAVSNKITIVLDAVELLAIKDATKIVFGREIEIMELGICFGKEGETDVSELHLAIINSLVGKMEKDEVEIRRVLELASFNYL